MTYTGEESKGRWESVIIIEEIKIPETDKNKKNKQQECFMNGSNWCLIEEWFLPFSYKFDSVPQTAIKNEGDWEQ